MLVRNCSAIAHVCVILLAAIGARADTVESWVTTEDGSTRLDAQPPISFNTSTTDKNIQIEINPYQSFQTITGMGSSFEHATCYNLSKLPANERDAVIEKLVSADHGIGMNLMRICMGTSDFAGEPWYSYDDVAEGGADLDLSHFSIEKDKAYILPVLKRALEINPKLLFFASPWSPPAWMKTSKSMLAGRIKSEYYDAYARYFVKFIQAYAAEGIPVFAVTPQNEPDFPEPHYPTCFWNGEMERDFIRDHLGPAIKAAGLHTLIWCWDHNWNKLEFPRAILSDETCAQYVDGTGFHFYEGKVEAQTRLHEMFPHKKVYFTEGSLFGIRGAIRLTEILNNWAYSYNAWVTMLDEHRKPNNGPHDASETCIELEDDGTVKYGFDYYMYGQFMKFVQQGAVRVETKSVNPQIPAVGFKNPDSQLVLIVVNASQDSASAAVKCGARSFGSPLRPRSVSTFRWKLQD